TEFAESAAYNAGRGGGGQIFSSARDLMEKTPGFWANYVRPKVEKEFLGLYRFLADPATGRNEYIELIEANLEHLKRELALAA
ncbi:MAG TPA: hypothetical protein DCE44_07045, partial [Verrucomicrobiales bacterium]|nr:hypothetical protein [Verrucomicrobiales bacterium]